MDSVDKVRENRLRRKTYRRGYSFLKSRVRDPEAVGYGKIRIEDEDGNEPPGFESADGLGLTLDELSVAFGEVGELGERWAVYRLYAEDGTLLYVGSSNHPRGRWSALTCMHWWGPRVKYPKVTWYDTEGQARDAETQAVLAEQPVHNVRLRSADLTERVTVMMTPQEIAELDAARGQLSRSEWMRRNSIGAEPRRSASYSDQTLPWVPERVRPQSSNWVVISTRVHVSLFGAIEKARGTLPLHEWISKALTARVKAEAEARIPRVKRPAQIPVAPAAVVEPDDYREPAVKSALPCLHPSATVEGDHCNACGQDID